MFPLGLAVALDVASALVALTLAASFAYLGWRLRMAAYVLIAVGFALVGVSYPGETASEQALQTGIASAWNALRLGGQVGGALVLFFGYLTVRGPIGPRLWTLLGAGTALVAVGLMVARLYTDAALFEDLDGALPFAQALAATLYFGCALFALSGFRREPRMRRALPPLGFLLLGAAKLAWLVRRLEELPAWAAAAYVARIAGLVILLAAILVPIVAMREVRRDAPA